MTDSDIQMAQVTRSAVRSAEQVVGLIESSKFGRVQVTSFAALEQISHILTDRDLEPRFIDELRRTKTLLTICGENTTRSVRAH